MDYIYVDKTTIRSMNMNEDELQEISKHLFNYKEKYEYPENICINHSKMFFIKETYKSCNFGIEKNKKKILTYIIFQSDGTIVLNDYKIECENGTILIFPSEWFISFTLSPSIINIGNVFIDI